MAVVALVNDTYELETDGSNANAPIATADVPLLVSVTSKESPTDPAATLDVSGENER